MNSDQLTEILDSGVLAGVTLKGKRPEMAQRKTIVKGFSEALRACFQLNSPEKTIINATRILSVKHWQVDDEAFRDFGCEDIKLVTSHFFKIHCKAATQFDLDEALNKLQLLKMAVKKTTSAKPRKLTYKRTCQTVTVDNGTGSGSEEDELEDEEDALETIEYLNEVCGVICYQKDVEEYEDILTDLAYN